MDRVLINSLLILVVGSSVTFLSTVFWFRVNAAVKEKDRLASENSKLMERVDVLENKISLVNQAVLPISAAFQAILIKELTHFHTPRMDELMRKIGPPSTLTDYEEDELATLLEERTRDMGDQISQSEREAAQMLPLVIKRAKREVEGHAHDETRLRLVSVVIAPTEKEGH